MSFDLKGVHHAPAQTFGAVRLLPLIRTHVHGDLRLGMRELQAPVGIVGGHYASYLPQAMVVQWSDDGVPLAPIAAELLKDHEKPRLVRGYKRMITREQDGLRFFPMHLAMERFMSLCLAGPEVAWPEYTKRALREGLSPRYETSFNGRQIDGLEDALRMFEIHTSQVGVALFVADALASVFIVSHPDDYRRMHRSLLMDFFGELIAQYAWQHDTAMDVELTLDPTRDLRAEVARARLKWGEAFRLLMPSRKTESRKVRSVGPFSLQYFTTELLPDADNHIGECILRDNGEVEYMKTYRLSTQQAKRGWLLKALAAHEWHLERTANALHCTKKQLIERIVAAGFGSLFRPETLVS